MVADHEVLVLQMSKSAIGHDSEPVVSIYNLHILCPCTKGTYPTGVVEVVTKKLSNSEAF
jgi:hypothetical protein